MATLGQIETSTKSYADARDKLAATLQKLDDQIEALKRQFMPGIKTQVNIAKEMEAHLKAELEDSKGLFVKPRTLIMHGIKVGFEKGKGKIEFADSAQVVKLIEKNFSDQADVLIKTKKTPVKKALSGLSAAELEKLGIIVDDTGDAVVIKPVDSQIEKLVDKLLKEKDEARGEVEEAA
jgi:hypothetical protein